MVVLDGEADLRDHRPVRQLGVAHEPAIALAARPEELAVRPVDRGGAVDRVEVVPGTAGDAGLRRGRGLGWRGHRQGTLAEQHAGDQQDGRPDQARDRGRGHRILHTSEPIGVRARLGAG